tara:strand:- start:4982 stop:6331 length:1350 start_codon:yes stop_codon:yes gene_type:complete
VIDKPNTALPFDPNTILAEIEVWFSQYVVTWPALAQAITLAGVLAVAFLVQRLLAPRFYRLADGMRETPVLRAPIARLRLIVAPLIAALTVWIAFALARSAGYPGELLRVAANLLTAWVVIRLFTSFIRQSGWASLIATLVWIAAALAILGWVGPVYGILDSIAFGAGEVRISLLSIIKGILLLGVFLLVANGLVHLADDRMAHLEGVSAAARVLIVKILRTAFFIAAFIIALTTVGVDLTAIAIFSGAVGVGVGFGLQKVISNLVSGILLLLDRSLKPGDVIEVGDAFGWINKMGARYLTVVTRDGKEYLIPNEDIITQQVVNWSYSDRAIRLRIAVGVSYGSDIRMAMALMTEATKAEPRILTDDAHVPQVRLTGFGDSSVDLELRIWVLDPEKGVMNVTSDVRLAIWDAFHENGIEFPFPQRDLHISSAAGLDALAERLARGDREK